MIKTIGFLGCGNMGGAIARAVCKAADPQNVYLANRTAAKAEALAAELGCNTTTNAEVAGRSDLIFLAVKPQMMEALLAPLRFTLNERPSRFILCSMAAGLSIARIQEMAGEDYPVIRIMPNTIWAAYSCALARGRPQATPPSASASMNWYTQAGPQPETLLAASIKASGTASSRPAGAISFRNSCSSSAVTLAEQYWIMPAPTEAGVLGMMRITG